MVSLQEQLASTGLVQHCHMLLQVSLHPILPGCLHQLRLQSLMRIHSHGARAHLQGASNQSHH
jgi:hypothetical protein